LLGNLLTIPAAAENTDTIPITNISLSKTSLQTPGQLKVNISFRQPTKIRGYQLRLTYPPESLELAEAIGSVQSAILPNAHQVALQKSSQPGELLLADVLEFPQTLDEDSELLHLTFHRLNDEPAYLEVTEVLIADEDGTIHTLAGDRLNGLRPLPQAFSLDQNIPNPFNPSTQINYQVPEAGPLSLMVYNILGQPVRTLIDGVQEPGHHQVHWDSRDNSGRPLANGVYFYRLVSGNGFVQSRRMLLLK
jgi:hypothetical protein